MHDPIPDDDREPKGPRPSAIDRNTTAAPASLAHPATFSNRFQLVSIEEASRVLGVRRSSVYRLMREGDLAYVSVLKRKRLVRVRDLEAFIDRCARSSSVFLSVCSRAKKARSR